MEVVGTLGRLIGAEDRRGLGTSFFTTAVSLGALESAAQVEYLGQGQEHRGQCQGVREAQELVRSWGWAVTYSQAQLPQVLGDTLASGTTVSFASES